MTRDELLALKRPCPKCFSLRKNLGITGQAHGVCYCLTCAGTGYVLPATEEVLALAGQIDDNDDWGCPPTLSDKHPVCADNLRVEVCAACWARWAREWAREEKAKGDGR